GVATSFQTSDLLSQDKFWHNELQHNELHRRLFGVSLELDETHSQDTRLDVQGLLPGHAYSVMRVHECRGKRFVIVRNPWGNSEWKGAWGDGSKEWTNEWLSALQELDHSFGDDGQFVMEYKDFLTVFSQIDRATIFDPSWSMSWHWLNIPPQPLSRLWVYGDIQFHISINRETSAVIVLSQMDSRYFRNLQNTEWHLDFVIHKVDTTPLSEPIATSGISLGSWRSVSCELNLQAGEYLVLPRIEAAYNFIIRKHNRVFNELTTAWAKVLPHDPPTDDQTGGDTQVPDTQGDKGPSEDTKEGGEENKKDKNTGDEAKSYPQVFTPDLLLGLRVYTQNGAVANVRGEVQY
ncbi:hypothetical protein CVT25_007906, partial [Psilocybe cyanescens]